VSGADAAFMREALALARRGAATTWPNPRVGALVVQRQRVVGRGFHERAGQPHAEIHALREAGARARAATLYVTLEPCCSRGRTGPCTDAILAAGIARVVAAMEDPDPRHCGRGIELLRGRGLDVVTGCMREAAELLNRPYLTRVRRGRPLFTIKLGSSWDARVAYSREAPGWFTGAAAMREVHRRRAEHPVLMTGIGTVLADDPALTVRHAALPGAAPARLVLDSRLRTPPRARILDGKGGPVWIACTELAEDAARRRLEDAGARVLSLPADAGGRVDLLALARQLGQAELVNAVWVEAGPTLVGALIDCRLADRWVAYLAPTLVGGGAALAAIGGRGAAAAGCAPGLTGTRVAPVGEDWRVEGSIVYPADVPGPAGEAGTECSPA